MAHVRTTNPVTANLICEGVFMVVAPHYWHMTT